MSSTDVFIAGAVIVGLSTANTVERFSGLQIPLRTSGTPQGSGRNHLFDRPLSPAEIASRLPELNPAGGRHPLASDNAISTLL